MVTYITVDVLKEGLKINIRSKYLETMFLGKDFF